MVRRKNVDHLTYDVTYRGLYVSNDGGQKVLKNYEMEVTLSQKEVDEIPIGAFAAFLAPVLMPTKYPDFAHVMTFEIVSHKCSIPAEEPLNMNLMTYLELAKYVAEETDVIPYLYPNVGQLKTAVEEWEQDQTKGKEVFLANQDRLQKISKASGIETRNKLMELNMGRIKAAGATAPLLPSDIAKQPVAAGKAKAKDVLEDI